MALDENIAVAPSAAIFNTYKGHRMPDRKNGRKALHPGRMPLQAMRQTVHAARQQHCCPGQNRLDKTRPANSRSTPSNPFQTRPCIQKTHNCKTTLESTGRTFLLYPTTTLLHFYCLHHVLHSLYTATRKWEPPDRSDARPLYLTRYVNPTPRLTGQLQYLLFGHTVCGQGLCISIPTFRLWLVSFRIVTLHCQT